MNWVKVEGESMRPLLSPGDSIAIDWSSTDARSDAKLGELVLGFGSDKTFIVHRVVGENLIKGDSAFVLDELSTEQIWGKVIGIRRVSQYNDQVVVMRANFLDRWIARLSRMTVTAPALPARVLRKLVFALAWIRKQVPR